MVHDKKQIFALADDGTLRLIEANPKEFKVIDETKVADDSWAHLAVQGDLVIVRTLNRLTTSRWDD